MPGVRESSSVLAEHGKEHRIESVTITER